MVVIQRNLCCWFFAVCLFLNVFPSVVVVVAAQQECDVEAGLAWCESLRECVGSLPTECPGFAGVAEGCRYTWGNLTWDLSGLDEMYVLKRRHATYDTKYFVRFCENFPGSDVDRECRETRGTAWEALNDSQAAYQVMSWTDGKGCYRCGKFGDSTTTEWGLVNEKRPADGVYVRYKFGNSCPGVASPTLNEPCTEPENLINGMYFCRRSMTLKLLCDDRQVAATDFLQADDALREEAGCAYVAVLNSKYGCPLECPRGPNGFVCSGHGLCAYDDDDAFFQKGIAGCDCDRDYFGPSCEHRGEDVVVAYVRTRDKAVLAVGAVLFFLGLGLCLVSARRTLCKMILGLRTIRSTPYSSTADETRPVYQIQAPDHHRKEDDDDDDENPFLLELKDAKRKHPPESQKQAS